jgi:hypothetical protein
MTYILLGLTMFLSLVVLLPFQINKYSDDPEAFMLYGEFC